MELWIKRISRDIGGILIQRRHTVERLFNRLKLRSFNFGSIDVLSQIIFAVGTAPCVVGCWAFNPLDASSNHPHPNCDNCDNQNDITDIFRCPLGDKIALYWELFAQILIWKLLKDTGWLLGSWQERENLRQTFQNQSTACDGVLGWLCG